MYACSLPPTLPLITPKLFSPSAYFPFPSLSPLSPLLSPPSHLSRPSLLRLRKDLMFPSARMRVKAVHRILPLPHLYSITPPPHTHTPRFPRLILLLRGKNPFAASLDNTFSLPFACFCLFMFFRFDQTIMITFRNATPFVKRQSPKFSFLPNSITCDTKKQANKTYLLFL